MAGFRVGDLVRLAQSGEQGRITGEHLGTTPRLYTVRIGPPDGQDGPWAPPRERLCKAEELVRDGDQLAG
jgi:hypothetical protein